MTGDSASDAPGDAQQRIKRVFVSYSRKDKKRVAEVVKTIESFSHEVWWDDRLVAGARFTAETEERLKAADFVVVLWTADSVKSEWVLDEAQVGKAAHKLVPLSLDGQEPPLGFRHIHTISFSNWSGEAGAECVRDLERALRHDDRAPVGQLNWWGTAASKVSRPLKRRFSFVAFIAAGVGAFLILGWMVVHRANNASNERVERALAALASRSVDGQRAPVAQAALEDIMNSGRSEDRAAITSFGRGDATGALDILERLAADLERSGDRNAAAEAYTRAAAIALMIDQGRGLASRRKAFELAPNSLTAFHGLFWDLYLLQGYEPATALAQSVVDAQSSPASLRAFAYAVMATTSVEARQDTQVAQEYQARLQAMKGRDSDPDIAAAAAFTNYMVEWRQDRLAQAEKSLNDLSSIAKNIDHPEIYPVDVGIARIRYAKGDWNGLFQFARSALEARGRAGLTSPGPLQFIACIVGMYTGAGDDAVAFCVAQSAQLDPVDGARSRLSRAIALAVSGQVDLAQREVAASRALAPSDTLLELDRLRIEVEIAAARGNLEEADTITHRLVASLTGVVNEKSRKAHAFRRLATLAIKAGEPARACAPLRRSGDLYTAVGGAPGAAAVSSMLDAAKCAE